MLGGFAGEHERGDGERGDRGAYAADFERGYTGDDERCADGDEEFVGAGGDGLEDVFVAYVGAGGQREEEKQQAEQGSWMKGAEGCAAAGGLAGPSAAARMKPRAFAQDDSVAVGTHRLTPRIQRPKSRPIQAENMAQTVAMPRPRKRMRPWWG